jgi:hypothetical protein
VVNDEDAAIAEFERMSRDFEVYAPTALRIVPKAGGIIPLELNIFQRFVHWQLEKQLSEKGYVRALILKPRQLGCSTYVEGRFYWKTTWGVYVFEDSDGIHEITPHGRLCLIMTHEDGATSNLFRMTKTYHENNMDELRPKTRASNAIELIFDNEKGTGLKSRFKVQTAGSKGGRALTYHLLHLSEYAYYGESGMNAVGGAMEGMPSEYPGILGTEVIKETTANGVGEPFEQEWSHSKSVEAEGKIPEYIRIFFPWYWYPAYNQRITETERKEIESTLTEEEKELLKQNTLIVNVGGNGKTEGFSFDGPKVSIEQLAWRRWKTDSLIPPPGMTKEEFFKREYPGTEEEAFVFSGSRVFPEKYLKIAEEECFAPIKIGELDFKTGKFVEKPNGCLKVWSLPKRGEVYVIGADVAEGGGGDYSSADVLRVPSGEQVAQWHGHISPDLFGDVLNHMGKFYGTVQQPLLGVEANNHGHTTVYRLKELGYRKLYMRDAVDGPSGKKVKKYGFLSTASTKPHIIEMLSADLRDGVSGVFCYDTISEMRTYCILQGKTGRDAYGAAPGKYDDRVMSRAIAGEMLRQVPSVTRQRKRTPDGYARVDGNRS